MRRAALLPAVLLVTVLAGCMGHDSGPADSPDPALSQPVHGVAPVEEVWVTSSVDGVLLHNAVYRPDGDGPFPVFINFSPYWGDTAVAGGDAFATYMVEEYVPRGYIVVLSAVRGTGHSGGCFQIAGDLEVQDAYDVVEHFATWEASTGAVAAGGKSYDSTTQNGLVAKQPHPALKGIFHVSGITDMYRYNLVGGVPYENGLTFTPRYFVTQGADEHTASPGEEDPDSLARAMEDAACTELPDHVASAQGSAATGQKDAYWQERDWNRWIAQSPWEGSIFFVHGLQDWNVKPDHILPWVDLLPQAIRDDSLFWLHQDTYNLGHVYPMRGDWNETMLRWMDHVLKGIDTGLLDAPAFQVEGSDGVWREAETWPGAQATILVEGTGPVLEVRFEEATRLSGVLRVAFTGTPLFADAVASVVVRDAQGEWVTEGVLRALYRNGLDTPAPVTPGTPVSLTFETYPVDHVVAAGDVLRFEVQGTPREALATPVQLAAFAPGAQVSIAAVQEPAGQGVLPMQPDEVPCFAC